jgi:hypothetical protein
MEGAKIVPVEDVHSRNLGAVKLPAPQDRLCERHGRPIKPSNWLRGSRSRGCSRCDNERNQINGSAQRHEQRKSYRRIVTNRWKYYSNGMRGIELFNRSIGISGFVSASGCLTVEES